MKVYTKDELEYLGEATIDLEEYVDCIDRKTFIVRLNDSQFADASVEFYVTATQILERKPRSGKNIPTVSDIPGGAHGWETTRNFDTEKPQNLIG